MRDVRSVKSFGGARRILEQVALERCEVDRALSEALADFAGHMIKTFIMLLFDQSHLNTTM